MISPLIVANWKMGVPTRSAVALARVLDRQLSSRARRHVIICPSATSITAVRGVSRSLVLGAQDCSRFDDASHTGDISVAELKSLGCSAVIIGHSERRRNHGETEEMVAQKMQHCLRLGLMPIICVGENAEERKQGKTAVVLDRQLRVVRAIKEARNPAVIVAYEPVWAIGAKIPADDQTIVEAHQHIRTILHRAGVQSAALLYGGAVDDTSVGRIVRIANVDGVLVGRASWQALSFRRLLQNAGL